MISPEEAKRRQDEDEIEELSSKIRKMLAKRPVVEHERMLRSAGLWEIWNKTVCHPPWKRCRHGGPYMPLAIMQAVNGTLDHFAFNGWQPTLDHVKLIGSDRMRAIQETMVSGGAPAPAIVFASLAADAFINKDALNTKKFMMTACILDALSSSPDLFMTLATDDTCPVVMNLADRLSRVNLSRGSLREAIEEFITCDCLARATRQKTSMSDTDFSRHANSVAEIWKQGEFQCGGHAGCTVIDCFADESVLVSIPEKGVMHFPLTALTCNECQVGVDSAGESGLPAHGQDECGDREVSGSDSQSFMFGDSSDCESISSSVDGHDDDDGSGFSNSFGFEAGFPTNFAGMPMNFAVSTNPMQYMNEMKALDLKKKGVALQKQGDYEKALPLMLRSVKLRENSHTICLSLSELADLYLDMLKLDKAEATCTRMLQEASTPYRYDNENQIRIANEVLADVQKARQNGLRYGMRVVVDGLKKQVALNGKAGIVRGRFRDSRNIERILVEVDSKRLLLQRPNIRASEKPRQTPASFDRMRFAFWDHVKRSRACKSSSATSVNSVASVLSAAGSHPKCFLSGTMFRCPNGEFTPIEDVQQGETLTGVGGKNVEVTQVIHHPPENRKLVFLHAAGAAIIVTADHRVVVPRGIERQTIPAGHLAVGDTLSCSDGEYKLIEVKHRTANVGVYQLTFSPDAPIETFYGRLDAGRAICTKGTKHPPVTTRRGGMKKHKNSQHFFEPTEDSWY